MFKACQREKKVPTLRDGVLAVSPPKICIINSDLGPVQANKKNF